MGERGQSGRGKDEEIAWEWEGKWIGVMVREVASERRDMGWSCISKHFLASPPLLSKGSTQLELRGVLMKGVGLILVKVGKIMFMES